MANEVEELLKQKLTPEEFEFAQQILKLPPTRIRGFIEERIKTVDKDEDRQSRNQWL